MSEHRTGRPVYDADSHMVEPKGWFENFASEYVVNNLSDGLFPLDLPVLEPVLELADRRVAGEEPELTEAMTSDLFGHPEKLKQWTAFGAHDGLERSKSLDIAGLSGQLVFPGQAVTRFAFSSDPDLIYGGADALNRGMVDFCSSDERLLPVGFVPLNDPERAQSCLREALATGIKAVWVISDSIEGRAPSHVAYDPLWAMLEEAKVPLVLHIGSGKNMTPSYMNTGVERKLDASFMNIESTKPKDLPVIHHSAERWLTCMIYDGVLERFPNLMIGMIELGANWLPASLYNLDLGVSALGKFDQTLKNLSLKPSEYIQRQVRVTPFNMENTGWILRNVGPDILMFNTDYPHPEGGKDPFGNFQRSLDSIEPSATELDNFYGNNFVSLMGL